MMIFLNLPGNEKMTHQLAKKTNAEVGEIVVRKFPDGECYIRILSDVRNKNVVLVCTLHEPDNKLLPLYFIANTAKSLGAKNVFLVAPYLAYMRQDKVFNPGEGETSKYFAKLFSSFVDGMITVDPHLHRIKALSHIYPIPNTVVHAADDISKWITENVSNPVIIGPDTESKQWVANVAKSVGAPYTILNKIRYSDDHVAVSIPALQKYKNATPVLIDDIISSAQTMMETLKHLQKEAMKPAVCIGIHAVFSGNAYQQLLDCGIDRIVTCNTIPHPSNTIDISDVLARNIKKMTS